MNRLNTLVLVGKPNIYVLLSTWYAISSDVEYIVNYKSNLMTDNNIILLYISTITITTTIITGILLLWQNYYTMKTTTTLL